MKYIIYGLIDPRNGYLKYIGKSSSGLLRPREHSIKSRLVANTLKNNWIKSLIRQDLKPLILVIEEFESGTDLSNEEIFYIEYFKSIGCHLLNGTSGGEGTLGLKKLATTRKKIQAAQPHKKAIIDNEGNIYCSISNAANQLNIRQSIISAIINKKKKSYKNKTFNLLTDGRPKNPTSKWKTARSIVDEQGTIYKSITEAASTLNLHDSNIAKVLTGKYKQTGGHVFKYVT